MVIIDIESNTSVGGLTLDPAGMHVLRGTMLLFLVICFNEHRLTEVHLEKWPLKRRERERERERERVKLREM